jgi:hypothetical protein
MPPPAVDLDPLFGSQGGICSKFLLLATMAEFSPDYGPFLKLNPLCPMAQVIILCIDIGVDGCILGLEPATNSGVVLLFGQKEGGVMA